MILLVVASWTRWFPHSRRRQADGTTQVGSAEEILWSQNKSLWITDFGMGMKDVGRGAIGQLPSYLLLQDTCHDLTDIHLSCSVPIAIKSRLLWQS